MDLLTVIITSGIMVALINGIQQIFLWKLNRKAAIEDKAAQKRDIISMGVTAMLEDRLLYLGTSYIENGIITASQHNAYERMYNAYVAEDNGNGTIEWVKEQIDKLEIKTLE